MQKQKATQTYYAIFVLKFICRGYILGWVEMLTFYLLDINEISNGTKYTSGGYFCIK